MAIANVVVRAGQAHLFNEKGSLIRIIGLAGGELVSFTANTISVKRAGRIWIYNEQGTQTGSTPAK